MSRSRVLTWLTGTTMGSCLSSLVPFPSFPSLSLVSPSLPSIIPPPFTPSSYSGIVSGVYIFDEQVRTAAAEAMVAKGLDPETMPPSLLTGRRGIEVEAPSGPKPQIDLTYYRAEPNAPEKTYRKAWPIYKEGEGWSAAKQPETTTTPPTSS
ncbi:hypothetical protein BDY24DRAFT_393759 [Mrakia frigida]|uniref:uncharacterized protein n=1 Tax=Mrakia frigida TaxID=29902 RepID=UPI003FCC2640